MVGQKEQLLHIFVFTLQLGMVRMEPSILELIPHTSSL